MDEQSKRKKAAKLTYENRMESVRLKAIWDRTENKLGQAAFGAEFDIGNQGMVWQCLNGQGAPISLKAARGFARGLGVDIADFSPRLAAEAAKNAASANLFPYPHTPAERGLFHAWTQHRVCTREIFSHDN